MPHSDKMTSLRTTESIYSILKLLVRIFGGGEAVRRVDRTARQTLARLLHRVRSRRALGHPSLLRPAPYPAAIQSTAADKASTIVTRRCHWGIGSSKKQERCPALAFDSGRSIDRIGTSEGRKSTTPTPFHDGHQIVTGACDGYIPRDLTMLNDLTPF